MLFIWDQSKPNVFFFIMFWFRTGLSVPVCGSEVGAVAIIAQGNNNIELRSGLNQIIQTLNQFNLIFAEI